MSIVRLWWRGRVAEGSSIPDVIEVLITDVLESGDPHHIELLSDELLKIEIMAKTLESNMPKDR